jgi:hypothetical protein
MRKKIVLESHDPRFWDAAYVALDKKVPFDVEHQGTLYEVQSFPGDELNLVEKKGARAGIRVGVTLPAPLWVIQANFPAFANS